MNFEAKILKAGSGDSILLHLNKKNILIDGGATMAYPNNLKLEIQAIVGKKEKLDLVIGTHFDEDHINGLFRLLEDTESNIFPNDLIKEFWFQIPPRITINHRSHDNAKVGVAKAKKTEVLLKEYNWKEETVTASSVPYQFDEKTKLWILSPSIQSLTTFKDKYLHEWPSNKLSSSKNDYGIHLIDFDEDWGIEDTSESNGSSIAFLVEYEGNAKFLLLGDAKPSVVSDTLKKMGYSKENQLEVDFVKLSHHGSFKSLSKDLLELISSKNFIISTNGIKHNLPNKKTFAQILKHYKKINPVYCINFIFNYEKSNYGAMFSNKDLEDFEFTCSYANFSHGHQIQL